MRKISILLSAVMIMCCLSSVIFATGTTETDVLTLETTGVESGSSYCSIWCEDNASGAVYAVNCAGGNNSIQLKSDHDNGTYPGIATTTSGGRAISVTVEWNSSTGYGKELDVYGMTEPYTGIPHPTMKLYFDDKGTKIGSIKCGTSSTLAIDGDYTYLGMRSHDGTIYLDKISIEWDKTVDPNKDLVVSFDGNGASGSMGPVTRKYGQTYALPSNGFTAPEGMRFDGWTVEGKDYPVGKSITVKSDVTVKAKWVDESTPVIVTDVLNRAFTGVTVSRRQ